MSVILRLFFTLLPLGWMLRAASGPAGGSGEVHAGESDDGHLLRLSPGQVLVIQLEAHLTAGFRWDLAGIEGAALRAAGEPESLPPGGPPGRLGAPGSQVFRFLAAARGEATLHLVYRRRWSPDAPPERSYSLRVVVE